VIARMDARFFPVRKGYAGYLRWRLHSGLCQRAERGRRISAWSVLAEPPCRLARKRLLDNLVFCLGRRHRVVF